VCYRAVSSPAFPDEKTISPNDLDAKKITILEQIKAATKGKRFNHYMPAQQLISGGYPMIFYSQQTLDNFENMFSAMNKLF
jgi:hypothetical protein